MFTPVDSRATRGKDVKAVNATEWRKHVVSRIVPESEGKLSEPVSLRIPEKLLARLDACAERTGHARGETILHLLRWALSEDEKDLAVSRPKKSA